MGSIYRLKEVKTSNEAVYRFYGTGQIRPVGSCADRQRQEAHTPQHQFPNAKVRAAATTRTLM